MSKQAERILQLLTEAGRRLSFQAAREARSQGLSRPQWAILELVEAAPGLSQREIAERLEVEPITVARMIDRLSVRDLVERRPDPRERRIWRVHLSPSGEQVRAEAWSRQAALGDRITASLPEEVTAALEDGLACAVAALVVAVPVCTPEMEDA